MTIKTHFNFPESDNYALEQIVADEIVKATRDIKCQLYNLDSRIIADVLKEKYKANINIELMICEQRVDKKELDDDLEYAMKNCKVVWEVKKRYKQHIKSIIIDERLVMFGSYSFSNNKNAFDVLSITDDTYVVKSFLEQWHKMTDPKISKKNDKTKLEKDKH